MADLTQAAKELLGMRGASVLPTPPSPSALLGVNTQEDARRAYERALRKNLLSIHRELGPLFNNEQFARTQAAEDMGNVATSQGRGAISPLTLTPTQSINKAVLNDPLQSRPETTLFNAILGAGVPYDFDSGGFGADRAMTSLVRPLTTLEQPTARAAKAARLYDKAQQRLSGAMNSTNEMLRQEQMLSHHRMFTDLPWEQRRLAPDSFTDYLNRDIRSPYKPANTEEAEWYYTNIVQPLFQRKQKITEDLKVSQARERKYGGLASRLFGLKEEVENVQQLNDPTFESTLKRTLSDPKMPLSFTPAMLQQLTNKLPGQGVRKEELKWLGWNDFVAQKVKEGKRVTREEVVDWVDRNTVDVVEHVGRNYSPPQESYQDFWNWVNDQNPNISPEQVSDSWYSPNSPLVQKWRATLPKMEGKADFDPKYGQWTLPGGENYREVLFQWGNKPVDPPKRTVGNWEEFLDDSGISIHRENGETRFFDEPYGKWLSKEEVDAQYSEYLDKVAPREDYRSVHFDQPNILAHTRLKDRTTPDGKRVLFVEEIQSDWHQAARDVPKQKEWKDKVLQWKKDNGLLTQDAQYDTFYEGAKPPDAPFADNWDELALKRILRMASEGGYDAVGWTTGAQQNARYSRTIQEGLDEIRYDPSANRLKLVKGGNVLRDDYVAMEDLPGQIGWDAAERVLRTTVPPPKELPPASMDEWKKQLRNSDSMADLDPGEWLDPITGEIFNDTVVNPRLTGRSLNDGYKEWANQRANAERTITIPASDLKVGKGGMETFYDKMLPAKALSLTKKHGGRVEYGKVVAHQQKPPTFQEWLDDEGFEIFVDDSGSVRYTAPNRGIRTHRELQDQYERTAKLASTIPNTHDSWIMQVPTSLRSSKPGGKITFPLYEVAGPAAGLSLLEMGRQSLFSKDPATADQQQKNRTRTF